MTLKVLQMPSESTQFSEGACPQTPLALAASQLCLLQIIALNFPGELVSRYPCLIFTEDTYLLLRWLTTIKFLDPALRQVKY